MLGVTLMPWRCDINGIQEIPEPEVVEALGYSLHCPNCNSRRTYFTSLALHPEWTWFCSDCGLWEATHRDWVEYNMGAEYVKMLDQQGKYPGRVLPTEYITREETP